MPYKGGGNRMFTVSALGPFSGNPSLAITAVEKAYETPKFACWQYFDEEGDFRHDVLLVKFAEPPKVLVKELQLLPGSKKQGGTRRRWLHTLSPENAGTLRAVKKFTPRCVNWLSR